MSTNENNKKILGKKRLSSDNERLVEHIEEAVAQIVASGKYPSYEVLGKSFSITGQHMHNVCERLGVKPRDIAAQTPPSPFVKAVLSLPGEIDTSTRTAKELAALTGYDALEMPSKVLRTHSVPFKHPDPLLNAQFIRAVKASNLKTENYTAAELAKAAGYPNLYQPSIPLKAANIPFRKSKGRPKGITTSKLVLKAMTMGDTSNLTLEEITEKAGITLVNPAASLRRNGIPYKAANVGRPRLCKCGRNNCSVCPLENNEDTTIQFVKAVLNLSGGIDTSKYTPAELASLTGYNAVETPSIALLKHRVPFKRRPFGQSKKFVAAVQASNLKTENYTALQLATKLGFPLLYRPGATLKAHNIPYRDGRCRIN